MRHRLYSQVRIATPARSCKKPAVSNDSKRWKSAVQAVCLIGTLFLLWPISYASGRQDVSDVSEEEYRLYSDYLNGLSEKDLGQLVPIDDHTWSPNNSASYWDEVSAKLKSKFDRLSQETLDDFYRKNRNGQRPLVTSRFNIKVKHVLLRDPANEIREDYIKGENGWERFYRKYQGAKGLVTFSRVGFNRHVDEALAHLVVQSGMTSGSSFFALLRKRGGVWRVISTLTMTQS